MEICLRLLTFNAPHSGLNDPPRFGDFQAHRHWMYLTKLPIEQWYTNNIDHSYQNTTVTQWRLDYPPITAYAHKLYSYTLPDKYSDHGNQDDILVLRMRLFILIIDVLLLFILKKIAKVAFSDKSVISILFAHPMLLLVDYIHYQPNNLMFLFLSITFLCIARSFDNTNWAILGTISFIFCIASKQMALVYAPVVCISYLALVIKEKSFYNQCILFIKLVLAVLFAFACCILPFSINYNSLAEGISIQGPAILSRIFPVHRGLFEDKLGNFWCISDVLFKWRLKYSEKQLAYCCTAICLLLSLPIAFKVFQSILKTTSPQKAIDTVFLGSSITSLIGFLFGYHIHEKTILLSIFCILLYTANYIYKPMETKHYLLYKYLVISSFNIYPLIELDNAVFYFIALHLIFKSLFTPKYKLLYYKMLIDVVYSPVIYSVLAYLHSSKIIKVNRFPQLFALILYTWCFIGNCVACICLIYCLWTSYKLKNH